MSLAKKVMHNAADKQVEKLKGPVPSPVRVLPPIFSCLLLLRYIGVLRVISFRFWLRRTKFRALSPQCNPALNIQKRDRPAKHAEVTAPEESSAARPTELANEGSFSYANWHSSFSYGSDLSVLKRANSFLEALELGRSSWNRSLPFSKLDGFRNSSYQSALSANTEYRIGGRYFISEIGNKSSVREIFLR